MNIFTKPIIFFLTILLINFNQILSAADTSGGPTSLDMIFSPVGIFCLLNFYNCIWFCYGRGILTFVNQTSNISSNNNLGPNCICCFTRSFNFTMAGIA